MARADRVALVTGAATGIGRATAIAIAGAGARVAVGHCRQTNAAQAVVHAIQATGRVAMGLLSACASTKVIQATYRDLPHSALWRMLWVTPQPPDYLRPERRAETCEDYAALLATIRAGDADGAEALMRRIMTASRDEVLHCMGPAHTDTVDGFRLQVW